MHCTTRNTQSQSLTQTWHESLREGENGQQNGDGLGAKIQATENLNKTVTSEKQRWTIPVRKRHLSGRQVYERRSLTGARKDEPACIIFGSIVRPSVNICGVKKIITNRGLSTANGTIHALDRKGPESGEDGQIAVKEAGGLRRLKLAIFQRETFAIGAKDRPGAESMPQAGKFDPKFEEVREKPPPKAGLKSRGSGKQRRRGRTGKCARVISPSLGREKLDESRNVVKRKNVKSNNWRYLALGIARAS
ncbi:hypothetical protein C8J57DRAFT_1237411 [Mycena rebaudengoi]|nr:hypothetical protein C8J57DRAFT_1237411 [Mycena rebaudengoi]